MAVEVERARRLFTADEYARMVEVGILTKYDRVELIHGEIVEKMPIGRGHFAAVAALQTFLIERLGRRAVVGSAGSLRVPPHSMPEPDLLVLAPRADFYREADLRPEDVLLLVEVADTSLLYDREVKGPLYASAGVAEYWIVDIEGGAVEIYLDPAPQGYRRMQRIAPGTSFAPAAFPDLVLSVSGILG